MTALLHLSRSKIRPNTKHCFIATILSIFQEIIMTVHFFHFFYENCQKTPQYSAFLCLVSFLANVTQLPHSSSSFQHLLPPTFCTLKMRHIEAVFVIEKLMRNFLPSNVLRSRLLMERPSSTASAF